MLAHLNFIFFNAYLPTYESINYHRYAKFRKIPG